MRKAVKPPVTHVSQSPSGLHAQSALQKQSPAVVAVAPKLSVDVISPARMHRAQHARRSQAVQHFRSTGAPGSSEASGVSPDPSIPHRLDEAQSTPHGRDTHTIKAPTYSDIRVVHHPPAVQLNPAAPRLQSPHGAHPTQSARPAQGTQPTHTRQAVSLQGRQQVNSPRTASLSPVRSRHNAVSSHRSPLSHTVRHGAGSRVGAGNGMNNISGISEQDLFSQALARATSHEQPAPRESAAKAIKRKSKKHRQALGIVASLSVFLMLFGFIAYQNRDNIQLQIASARAGFSASTPLYKPDGYVLGKTTYGPGAVAVQYQHPNNQSFTLSQKKSNWDSQTLLENFVATSDEPYQGYQSNGRTVYVYGEGKATWVNGGIWYQIQGANELSDEQLVKIAASM